MKLKFKLLAIIVFLGIFLHSCDNNDDTLDYGTDINPERFENIEIGNGDFKVPQFNTDLHIQFDYNGKSKVKKMYFDINPIDVSEPASNEGKWTVTNYLVPEKYYKEQINPHVHHHVYFDPNNKHFPLLRPSKGIYSLKITVVEEGNSESVITKEFEIVKKFSDVEIGHDNQIEYGNNELHTEFTYDGGNNTISEIKYELWFEEWRNDKNVPVGSWDKELIVLPKELYENKKDPNIHYHLPINPEFPIGGYWLNIYVKESGENEDFKLSIPFSIVE